MAVLAGWSASLGVPLVYSGPHAAKYAADIHAWLSLPLTHGFSSLPFGPKLGLQRAALVVLSCYALPVMAMVGIHAQCSCAC